MDAPTTRIFTPARIVSLALVALAVCGLLYLRFGTGGGSVSVPSGAHAGQLTLHPCHYETEHGSVRADCGTLVVPENRHDPDSRLIALPVTRIRAQSAEPGLPIFRLEGGPGLTNMRFRDASRLTARHDVVLVGYRGVDGSSRLDCPEVTSALRHSRDLLSEESFRDRAAAYRQCAARLQREGVDLAGYTLPERVDDLDAARRALGYDRIDLLSESAGTRTAMIYAWRYPQRIHRSVMIGVNAPGAFLWDAKTTGEQIDRYASLCATDESCSSRTADLTSSLHSTYEHIPGRWWFLPIKKGNVEAAGFFGLVDATTDGGGPLAAPWTIDTLLAAGDGDASGAWLLSVMGQMAFPHAQVWGDVAAVGQSDAAYARRFFATRADEGSAIGSPGTDLIWAGGRLLDAWPASPDENEYTRVEDSSVETLLIGGNLDFATPPQTATRELLPHLRNGRQVILSNLGHTGDFWSYEPAASQRLLTTFFDSGRVDTSLYTHNSVDFTPTLGHGKIAQIALGSMLALAALTVLSLLWMPLRVHLRGAFGRKAGATLRWVYPIVLGLGGWSIGALLVLTTMPSVPLDDELLTALSVGLPIGLSVYHGWVSRDWSATTKVTGFAAAAAGALVAAWLGFHATDGMPAVLTAIAGAAAGANLTLLALDMAGDRQVRDRALQPAATEPLEARPSVG